MEFRSGSIYIRQPDFLLETGHVVPGHKHNFDHTTFFGSGLWRVEVFGEVFVDGKLQTKMVRRSSENGKIVGEGYDGPVVEVEEPMLHRFRDLNVRGGAPHSLIPVEASIVHRMTLLEGPGTYACIFSHRHPDGTVSEEFTGWMPAYH